MLEWLQQNDHLAWLGALSLLTFVASLVLVPVLVVRMPADYFVAPARTGGRMAARHPLARLLLVALKNGLGILLLLAGIAMLVLPGQGLLTMILGLLLLDFPGKYRLERRLILHPRVLPVVNHIRRRRGHPPLRTP